MQLLRDVVGILFAWLIHVEAGRAYRANVEELFLEFSDMVYKIAFVRMKNPSDTDEVFQEVFLRLVKHSEKIESMEHAKAWLIRVTINCCNTQHSSSWNTKTTAFGDYETEGETLNHSQMELLEAVGQLTAEHREVIHLFYYEDYSIEDIAELLKRKQSTVKSQLRRARLKLKDVWEGDEI